MLKFPGEERKEIPVYFPCSCKHSSHVNSVKEKGFEIRNPFSFPKVKEKEETIAFNEGVKNLSVPFSYQHHPFPSLFPFQMKPDSPLGQDCNSGELLFYFRFRTVLLCSLEHVPLHSPVIMSYKYIC